MCAAIETQSPGIKDPVPSSSQGACLTMKTYEFLARRNWPKSYTGKILLVSFLGVHVPMIGAVTYVLLADPTPFSQEIGILLAMLAATLLGTAGTMLVMNALLAPVVAATNAAEGYLRERKTPRMPTRYTDSAGVLMASVQECITRLDSALATTEYQREELARDHSEKFKMLAGMRHDFRTPLTHILGFAELMKSEAIGPLGNKAYHSYLEKIGDSGRDLLQTLQSVLDLSDGEARRQLDEDSESFDIVAMARDAVSLEHLHAEKCDIAVSVEAPAELALYSVRSVMKNLLGTLLDATITGTPAGRSVTLRVSEGGFGTCLVAESHGGQLCIEDVPANLAHFFGTLPSSAGAPSARAETSTPLTVRLTLIATLAKAIGAELAMDQTAGEGFRIAVTLQPHQAGYAIAAE